MYLLCHPWVILNIVIVNHRQHHHSGRWCHTAQQHFAIINYVYHPPDHHFLHLHFHHQQDDRSTEHLWPIINHQGSNPNHQLWSRFINHRQISIFLCVCALLACVFSYHSQGVPIHPAEVATFAACHFQVTAWPRPRPLWTSRGYPGVSFWALGHCQANRPGQWDMRMVECIIWLSLFVVWYKGRVQKW